MWERKNFSDCATELEEASRCFRSAYSEQNSDSGDELKFRSIQGRDLLDILALTVRREIDDKTIAEPAIVVGALKPNATLAEQNVVLKDYRPPYFRLDGFGDLGLREALNKIAHAQRGRTSFFVDQQTHDIILCGEKRDFKKKKWERWIAVISIAEVCEALRKIPDIDRPDTFGIPLHSGSQL